MFSIPIICSSFPDSPQKILELPLPPNDRNDKYNYLFTIFKHIAYSYNIDEKTIDKSLIKLALETDSELDQWTRRNYLAILEGRYDASALFHESMPR